MDPLMVSFSFSIAVSSAPCVLAWSSFAAAFLAYTSLRVFRSAASSELSVSTAADRKGFGACVVCFPYMRYANPSAMFCACSSV